MRNYVVNFLAYALEGVSDEEQNIFETYKERRDVVVHGNEEECNNECNESSGCEEVDTCEDAGDEQGNGERTETCNEEQQREREVNITLRRTETVRILTETGAEFVNAIMECTALQRAEEFMMNGQFKVGEYPQPNLNAFNVINESGRTYYCQDAETFSDDDERFILKFDKLSYLDIDWVCDDEGNPYIPMSPERYSNIWKRIIAASHHIDSSKVTMSKNVTKPAKYWTDIKAAYNESGQLMRMMDKSLTTDDMYMLNILRPEFDVPTVKFCRTEEDRNFDSLDIAVWSIQPLGTKAETMLKRAAGNDVRVNPNSNFNRIKNAKQQRNNNNRNKSTNNK